MRWPRILAAVIAALGLATPAAHAAFPGSNGRIAFTTAEGISLIQPDGTGRTLIPGTGALPGGGGARRPAWSPKGDLIAFNQAVAGGSIWVVRPDGSDLRKVIGDGGTPNWSPDGQRLVFHSENDGNSEIYTVALNGTDRQRLTTNGAADFAPIWSPDGSTIAFVSNRTGTGQLWAVPAGGGTAGQLTQAGDVEDRPSWHPNGGQIAYTRDPGDFVDLFVVGAGGGAETRITFAGNDFAQSPAFSPDGTAIAYKRQNAIWTAGAGGGGDAPIPNTTGAGDPDWEPTGCTKTVVVGSAVAEGCFEPLAGSWGDWTTEAPAYVGGFDIRPEQGGKLVLHAQGSSPSLGVQGAGATVFFDGKPTTLPVWSIPVGTGSAEIDLAGATGSVIAAMSNLPLLGKLKVAWSADGKSATIEGSVKVVDGLLKGTVGDIVGDDLEAEMSAKLANGRGLELQSWKVTVPPLTLTLPTSQYAPLPAGTATKIGFAGGEFKYALVDGKTQFTLTGGLTFPFADLSHQLSLSPTVVIYDGELAGFGLKVDGINEPLGESGLFLQALNGTGVWNPRFGLDLGASATLGPKPPGSIMPLLKLDGSLRVLALVSACTGAWSELTLKANIPILEQLEIGKGEVTGAACLVPFGNTQSWVESGSFKIGLKLGGVENAASADGAMSGWINLSGANFIFTGSVRLPAAPPAAPTSDLVLPGNGVASSKGYAFCANFGLFKGGFGAFWNQPTTLFTGCDLAPWSGSATPTATATAAAVRRSVAIPSGLPFAGIAAVGSTTAPRVRITSPGGTRITAKGGLVRKRDLVIYPVPLVHRTYVFIRKPRAGVWRVAGLKGDRVMRVEFARGLSEPKIKALVRRRGERYRLVYTIAKRPGQRIQFVERTKGGGIHRIGQPTGRAKGTIKFKPASSPERRRTVEADVVQDKLPRATLRVTRYKLAS